MSYDTYLASLNPTAWWKLADTVGSSTAADSSGNSYTLTKTGTVTFGTTGTPVPISSETCALFDGSTGFLSSTLVTALTSVINGNFTFNVWCNPTSWTTTGGLQIFSAGHTGTDQWFQIIIGDGFGEPGIVIGFYSGSP